MTGVQTCALPIWEYITTNTQNHNMTWCLTVEWLHRHYSLVRCFSTLFLGSIMLSTTHSSRQLRYTANCLCWTENNNNNNKIPWFDKQSWDISHFPSEQTSRMHIPLYPIQQKEQLKLRKLYFARTHHSAYRQNHNITGCLTVGWLHRHHSLERCF